MSPCCAYIRAGCQLSSSFLCICRPHHFNYTGGMYAVNEHFQRVDGPTYAPATVDKIALHHYVLKSEQVGAQLMMPVRSAAC